MIVDGELGIKRVICFICKMGEITYVSMYADRNCPVERG